jgi:hypothetical protein
VSPSASPSAGYQDYTKGDYASLPTGILDLENAYTGAEVSKVATNDEDRVPQTATSEYMIHQFKDVVGSKTAWVLTWEGQSTQAPSTSKVVLQIYDRNGTTWEDVDEENGVGADTDFILTGNITSDADHYKDENTVIVCRVYQLAT